MSCQPWPQMLLPLFGDASEPTWGVCFFGLYSEMLQNQLGKKVKKIRILILQKSMRMWVVQSLKFCYLVLWICVGHLVIITGRGSRMHFFFSFLNQLQLALVLVFSGKNWLLLIHVFKAFSKTHYFCPRRVVFLRHQEKSKYKNWNWGFCFVILY